MNNWQLIGRLGKDPEVKVLAGGTSVCNFSVAYSETYNNKTSGEKEKKTSWFDCAAFGKTGELIGQYFGKGDLIGLGGKVEARKYTDKEGKERTAWSMRVNEFSFCGGGKKQDASDAPSKAFADDEELFF